MKVLHIITGLRYGGAEKLLYLTCKWCLETLNIKIDIIYFDPNAPMRPYFENLRIKCTQINRSLQGFLALVAQIKQHQYDVVHTHLIHADMIGRIAALLSGANINVFTTVHGTEWFRRENHLYPMIVRLIDRLLSRPRNHFIIAISKSVRDLLLTKEKINPDKITLLYNAVEVHSISRKDRKDSFKVLFVGRLSPEKNIPSLIHATKLLVDENISVTILGDGQEKENLERLVEHYGLEKIVSFIDGCFDVNSFYRSHDVLVLPSQNEGLGIVILEAFSHAMPVIGSNVEGIAELLENGRGLLYECGNSIELAEKIVWLRTHSEDQITLGQAGYHYVARYHNMENYIVELVKLYNSCGFREKK